MDRENTESGRSSAENPPTPPKAGEARWSTSAWAEGVEPGPRLPVDYNRETASARGCLIAALILAIVAVAAAIVGLSGGFEMLGDARLQ